jgi:hypothetical protein
MKLQVNLLGHDGKKIAIFSHERSGTHFLMNSIAMNFSYLSHPWLDFDSDLQLNFHSPDDLRGFFSQMQGKPIANILKSHHSFDFMAPVIDDICNDFKVFYIYRDPRDAIISHWRLINQLNWDEGPQGTAPGEFVFNPPSGRMMRYQKHNEASMLTRWQTHVTGWMDYAERDPAQAVMPIKYENLNLHFNDVISAIGEYLELPLENIIRPDKEVNVIGSGKGTVGGHADHLSQEDNNKILELIGATLKKYGYK